MTNMMYDANCQVLSNLYNFYLIDDVLTKSVKLLRKKGGTIDTNLLAFGVHSLNYVQCNFCHPPKIPTLTKKSGSVPISNRKQMVQRQ